MKFFFCLLALLNCATVHTFAQSNSKEIPIESDHKQLAIVIQNPFALLYNFSFQNNLGLNYGANEGVQNITNVQPVIPFHVSERWKLLTHPIVPIYYTSSPEKLAGLGDVNFEAVFSCITNKGWVLGFGAITGFPTATNQAFGTGKWTAGPLSGFFRQFGNFTISFLITQQWSYAGKASRSSVSIFQVQPNINYNFPNGLYLFTNPQISGNLVAASGQRWLLPLGVGLGDVFEISQQKMNLSLECYQNVIRPDAGPTTAIVLTLQFLFPRHVW